MHSIENNYKQEKIYEGFVVRSKTRFIDLDGNPIDLFNTPSEHFPLVTVRLDNLGYAPWIYSTGSTSNKAPLVYSSRAKAAKFNRREGIQINTRHAWIDGEYVKIGEVEQVVEIVPVALNTNP